MFAVITASLTRGVNVAVTSGGTLSVEIPNRHATMNLIGLNGYADVLAKLQDGPLNCTELMASANGSGETKPALAGALRLLAERSLIGFECVAGAEVLLRATSVAASWAPDFRRLDSAERYQLSRFAYLHRDGGSFVLDSGASRWRIFLSNPAMTALIAATVGSVTIAEATACSPDVPPDTLLECLGLLVSLGAVMPLEGHDEPADERNPELAQREFHDVLMHAESRRGFAFQQLGGTYPFAGKYPPTKAIKEVPSVNVIDLYRPDMGRIRTEDMPLGEVMERRRSVRRFAQRHMTQQELGEFLFRVGRVRAVNKIEADGSLGPRTMSRSYPNQTDQRRYETTRRTYPSGGAAYDLEIYITAWNCEGLRRGMYHYEPADHVLTLVTERPRIVWQTMRDAYQASSGQGVPQLVITLASRFNRLAWKYRGISYTVTLKNAGVLYEAMYLTATAMGLAPCGLGCGDSALFSQATGLDPLVESSVGEFMLGVPAITPTDRE